MSTENIAKKAIEDKIEAQVKTIEAKLDALKLKAEAAKAIAEVKAIADLVTKRRALAQKLSDLKTSGEGKYQQAKADIESRVTELEQSVQAMESKFKAA
jgi:outer membrane murein-binding lipoprotein Lpp